MPIQDAVVVGSGPNGLAAAITLARAGRSVLVLEANDTIGGGARSAELTLPGFTHDLCSAIHPLAVASPCFEDMSLSEHGLSFVHPDLPLAHPLDDGAAVVLDRSVAATSTGLGGDGRSYNRFMQPLVDSATGLLPHLLGPPLRVPRHPVALARFGLSVGLRSTVSFARSRFSSSQGRALFAGCAAHSMLSLDRAPSAAIGTVLALLAHTVGWPCARAGSQSIAGALAARLRDLGGEIVTQRRVASLGDLPAHHVALFDVTPRQLLAIAGDALPGRYGRSLARYRYGPGVFKMDWALDGPIPWAAEECGRAGTVHVGGTIEEIAAAEEAVIAGRHPERPFVILAQQSVFDKRAPDGKHTGWAYCHVPNGSGVDMSEAVESQIERFAPGFRDRILARSVMGPRDVERHNANYVGGDINGGVQDLRQVVARPVARLVPYATPNPGIYLCSSSTPPGGGVHGMCGYLAAGAALKRSLR
jgi:phytoene dehydrogenase-like protein